MALDTDIPCTGPEKYVYMIANDFELIWQISIYFLWCFNYIFDTRFILALLDFIFNFFYFHSFKMELKMFW